MPLLCVAPMIAASGFAGPAVVTHVDGRNDAVFRRTDPDLLLPFSWEPEDAIDLLAIRIGRWAPSDPRGNPFIGDFSVGGHYLRLELLVAGLVNPPGTIHPEGFDPFRYGDRPIYGFVEIDVDLDPNTGGELAAPQFRYLANAARFGGLPLRPVLRERAAVDHRALDRDFRTPPFIERQGEEFHLALLGGQWPPNAIDELRGDGDGVFEAGETWVIFGSFLHRAHGYEPFSLMEGGSRQGEYAPRSPLQFAHDEIRNETRISLIFPLTNLGAALMKGAPIEPMNQDASDQTSIAEALQDLHLSAFFLELFPTGMPEEALITNWVNRQPFDFLDPTKWEVTALVGTSYESPLPGGVFFAWTDLYPHVVRGDVDGSGVRDGRDLAAAALYRERNDPLDGRIDGAYELPAFAASFSVFDYNYDGVVDAEDVIPIDQVGDADGDGDVDLSDIAHFQRCFEPQRQSPPVCRTTDVDGNLRVDLDDLRELDGMLTGPRHD